MNIIGNNILLNFALSSIISNNRVRYVKKHFHSKSICKSDLSGRRLEGCTSGARVGFRFAPVGRYFPRQASVRERSAPDALPLTALKRPRFGDPS